MVETRSSQPVGLAIAGVLMGLYVLWGITSYPNVARSFGLNPVFMGAIAVAFAIWGTIVLGRRFPWTRLYLVLAMNVVGIIWLFTFMRS